MKNLEWYISPQGFPQLKNPHLKCANPSISLDQSFLIWGFRDQMGSLMSTNL